MNYKSVSRELGPHAFNSNTKAAGWADQCEFQTSQNSIVRLCLKILSLEPDMGQRQIPAPGTEANGSL